MEGLRLFFKTVNGGPSDGKENCNLLKLISAELEAGK
jgi:hypothetical protein